MSQLANRFGTVGRRDNPSRDGMVVARGVAQKRAEILGMITTLKAIGRAGNIGPPSPARRPVVGVPASSSSSSSPQGGAPKVVVTTATTSATKSAPLARGANGNHVAAASAGSSNTQLAPVMALLRWLESRL